PFAQASTSGVGRLARRRSFRDDSKCGVDVMGVEVSSSIWGGQAAHRFSRRAVCAAHIAAASIVLPLVACDSREATPSPSRDRFDAPLWIGGSRYVYRLELESNISLADSPMMAFSMKGDLALHVRSLEKGVVEFAASLPSSEFETLDAEQNAQFQVVRDELRRPFAFKLTNGRLSEVRLPPKWSTFAGSIARTVAAALQFSKPPSGAQPAAAWTAREVDATGEYDVEYQLVQGEPSGRTKVSRRKLRYDTIAIGKVALA